METYDVWMTVAIPIVVTVQDVDRESATLKAEYKLKRGEMTDRIINQVRAGAFDYDVDEVEEVES